MGLYFLTILIYIYIINHICQTERPIADDNNAELLNTYMMSNSNRICSLTAMDKPDETRQHTIHQPPHDLCTCPTATQHNKG